MKKLRNLRNTIKENLESLGYFLSPFWLLYLIGFFVFNFGYHAYEQKSRDLQDQLTIQQSHTERWKMEAERNGIALQECVIDNKNNKAKLEEIKSILQSNY